MRRWSAAIAIAATVFAVGAGTAIGEVTPRPGTYSGAGAMVDDPSYGMTLGFSFDGATVTFPITGFETSTCTGFISVDPAPVTGNRFTASSSNSDRTVVIKGRWSKPGVLKGKMTMTVLPGAACGTPGTYVYKYGARRYGGQ